MTGLPVLAFGRDRRWTAHLQRVLAPRSDLEWCGMFAVEALPATTNSHRGLWLLDGDDVRTERMPAHEPHSPRLYFYRHPDVTSLRHCARLGGSGCLDKQVSPEVLLRAVRAVEAGMFAVDISLLTRALAAERRSPAPVDDLSHLTERQREIVHWASLGMSNKQIGRRLGISPETVKSHLHQVFAREGISGRVALLAMHRPDEKSTSDESLV
ncbi:MAG TPA: response regulator transcription factor [Lysobacter sp.]|nr:response regulator transcription factor [Lysobacter sp.]